ncbi:polysaccharide biosynthesis protein [Cytobacillus sp. Hz8]|uniref:polysaccharide biosynthesis protein n=1 Tax=Cytobacillus sp. Hz8 TaxID=3347168 RepID=UPI0035DC2764
MFKNTTVLVTGGTGSWGTELIHQLLAQEPNKIIVYSRNENNQVEMRRKIEDPRLHFFIGDIRDKDSLNQAFIGVDYVFHLAALKHVPVCEENPLEALKTNVIGTQNIIEAAISNKIKKVVYVSTDKAADPVNSYGMTKALGERLMIHANQTNSLTKFFCVRGGNVLGSSGSVVPLFKKQIQEKAEVHITDMRMTRYFVTPQQAIKSLLKAAELGNGGEIFVLRMDACRIIDLAEILIEHSDKEDVKITEIGARPGEKLEEVLVGEIEKSATYVYDQDLLVILSPQNRTDSSELNSLAIIDSHHLMPKEALKQILSEGGFLD